MEYLKIKSFTIAFVCIMITIMNTSCYYDTEQELYSGYSKTTCDTSNITYSSSIATIIKHNCITCHGTSYATLGGGISLNNATDIATIAKDNNRLNNSVGSASNYSMPKGGNRLSDCDILKIQLWVSKGAQNN